MSDIKNVAKQMMQSYETNQTTGVKNGLALPDRSEVIKALKEIRRLLFPEFFAAAESQNNLEAFTEEKLNNIYGKLNSQMYKAYSFSGEENAIQKAEETTQMFVEKLPELRNTLFTDLQATFEGDPAAKSKEEIIFSYPGFFAICVYRIAHVLHKAGVPFIPRMLTEYANGKTGIDIHPGAEIDEYFFIDHGTGVVIGETTKIGKYVKIYQMVTLGALSPRKGQILSGVKRHPTVEDNVTIYSGSSILGGETIIGKGAVIGGNCFLTESVGAGMKVSIKQPELIFIQPKK